MEDYKKFCPECGAELPENGEYHYDFGIVTYVCSECGNETSKPIESEYKVGDYVTLIDQCNDDFDYDDEYDEEGDKVCTITDIIGVDGEEVIYELDNGIEVYEHEIELAN